MCVRESVYVCAVIMKINLFMRVLCGLCERKKLFVAEAAAVAPCKKQHFCDT